MSCRTLLALLVLSAAAPAAGPALLKIDYPAEGSLFPPDTAPPTFLWHDDAGAATWRIDIAFARGAQPIRLNTSGPLLRPAAIDPDCVSSSNEPPPSDPRQHSWAPSAAVWAAIRRAGAAAPATVTLTGLRNGRAVSTASVRIRVSTDPVGAPIFYRDVPLMPAKTITGAIQPLAPQAVRLVKWRIRDVGQPRSQVVMENLPVCANCHSFSRDGQHMGMDLDGLRNNKGRYFIAQVRPETEVRAADVVQWATQGGRLTSPIRAGFMSQISPAGDTVMTTIAPPGDVASNYYVANFADYRFLQVFFPTRGILAWFNRQTGLLQPLPGADDPAFVQFGAVWSPAGDSLVFARAPAQEANPPGRPAAQFANDPNELQIRYDLYRIPFDHGRGGRAEPIAGASANGMSNTFPRLSPDGRWLVFVQASNGQLMRPDSQLYIVAAGGGTARRMNCNTARMNSWHSFSPNGRWLVFSSKARSPYTQMYLTHIDAEGNDTPPILIENSTAANRAVNLPEFVNIPAGGMKSLGGPAIEYYRLYDRALYLQNQKRFAESAAAWQALLAIAPEDQDVRRHLGMTLLLAGRRADAAAYLTPAGPAAISAHPIAREHYDLALLSLRRADRETALGQLRQALAASPDYAEAHQKLAEVTPAPAEALAQWNEVIRLQPNNPVALRQAAWLMATNGALRNAAAALDLATRALLLAGPADPDTLDTLAAAYAENGRYDDAIATARRAIAADPARAPAIEPRIERYQARQSWRQ